MFDPRQPFAFQPGSHSVIPCITYFTWESYTLQNYDDIVVGMLLIGLLGMGSSLLVRRVGALATPWAQAGEKR